VCYYRTANYHWYMGRTGRATSGREHRVQHRLAFDDVFVHDHSREAAALGPCATNGDRPWGNRSHDGTCSSGNRNVHDWNVNTNRAT
jgi:hypothetical protein